MNRDSSSHRLRLRVSLWTLTAVLITAASWLGWQLSVVRERQQIRNWIPSRGGEIICLKGGYSEWAAEGWVVAGSLQPGVSGYKVPRMREMLGDETAALVRISPALSAGELDRVKHAFPEAGIFDSYRKN